MKFYLIGKIQKKGGFTLLMASLVASLLLAIGFSIFNIAFKEVQLSSVARESHFAFYAADSGAECALYQDLVEDVFNVSPENIGSAVECLGMTITSESQDPSVDPRFIEYSCVGGDCTPNIFTIFFPDSPYCAYVEVAKCVWDDEIGSSNFAGGCPDNFTGTIIKSRGYNTCDPGNPRRVERAVQVVY